MKWKSGEFLTEHLKLQSQIQESEEIKKKLVEALEESKPHVPYKLFEKIFELLKDNNKQK